MWRTETKWIDVQVSLILIRLNENLKMRTSIDTEEHGTLDDVKALLRRYEKYRVNIVSDMSLIFLSKLKEPLILSKKFSYLA